MRFPTRHRMGESVDASGSGSPVSVAPRVAVDRKPHHAKGTLALFSAAVTGMNSGDALIADAVARLLGAYDTVSLPLLAPLTEEQLERVNSCSAAVICGTNLYQHVFACALTPEVVQRIRVPIVPLGIGASAPVGRLPRMNDSGIRAVRMIHDRCVVGSVRDPASLAFAQAIGVRNVELTGCPVLFHAMQEPDFASAVPTQMTVAVRARLLHVEPAWNAKAFRTLERLCREFRPRLILQSPHDRPIAEALRSRFGVEFDIDLPQRPDAMIRLALESGRTAGFRLHFGMVSWAYGRPSTMIGTDIRTSSFCEMMGIRFHDMAYYDDDVVVAELRAPAEGVSAFAGRWRHLAEVMHGVLHRNGLCAVPISVRAGHGGDW